MRKLLIYCDLCKQQHFTEDFVSISVNGENLDLCSVECYLKYAARLYHFAAAKDLPIAISTGMKLEVKKA